MAFSIGFITYTISRLVSKGLLKPTKDTSDGNKYVDAKNGNDSSPIIFDEKKIAQYLEKMTKPEFESFQLEQQKLSEANEGSADDKKLQEAIEKELEDIYEEVTVREAYLRYSHGFGDLANLRMRNDFVFKAGDLNKETNQENIQDQQNRFKDKYNIKTEKARFEQRRFEEIRLQRHSAEQYTQQLGKQE